MRSPRTITVAPSKAPDWLTTPIEFEDQIKIRIRRNSMRIIVVIVAGLLVWSAVAPIRELSIAHGQLIPLYEVRSIQHLEGGIVDEILVAEGQLVDKGQPLMRLQPAGMESELATLRVRSHNLALEKMRAEALLAHRDMDTRSLHDVSADLIANHVQVHQLRLEQRTKEHDVLSSRIAQKKAEIAGTQVTDSHAAQIDRNAKGAARGQTNAARKRCHVKEAGVGGGEPLRAGPHPVARKRAQACDGERRASRGGDNLG